MEFSLRSDLAVTAAAETRRTCLAGVTMSSADRHITSAFLQYRTMQLIEICASRLIHPELDADFILLWISPHQGQ